MKRTRSMSRWVLVAALAIALSMLSASSAGAVVAPGTTTRVSVGLAGLQGNGYSHDPSISADGRYVAFMSVATSLVAGDTNGVEDVFVRDRVTGVTTRVSVSSSGVEGNGGSGNPSISSDGRYVAYESEASNLVASDTNGDDMDVFLRDRVAGTTTRVSVNSSGVGGMGISGAPSISADGRYVAFSSDVPTFIAGDTNGADDVFVRDRVAGTTTRVSVSSSGVQGNDSSERPSISADGRYVVFDSVATSLTAGDTNGKWDVYLRDRALSTTTRVSVDSAGVGGSGYSAGPSISADGRYVVFESDSALVASDTNGFFDVYLRDRALSTTTRVSVDSSGVEGNGDSAGPSITAYGRYVTFASEATSLVAGDTNLHSDIFVRDRATGATTRVSVDSSGVEGNDHSEAPAISSDGCCVAFESGADNLVANDTNGFDDVFLYAAAPVPTSITIRTNATSVRTGAIPILSGTVTPIEMIGKNIVVYVRKPGKTYWSLSSNRTVYYLGGGAAWQYKYYFKPGMVKGSYVFKAVVPAYSGFLASTSPTTVSIRLR